MHNHPKDRATSPADELAGPPTTPSTPAIVLDQIQASIGTLRQQLDDAGAGDVATDAAQLRVQLISTLQRESTRGLRIDQLRRWITEPTLQRSPSYAALNRHGPAIPPPPRPESTSWPSWVGMIAEAWACADPRDPEQLQRRDALIWTAILELERSTDTPPAALAPDTSQAQ